MKSITFPIKKVVLLFCLLGLTGVSTLFGYLEEQAVSFQFNNRAHQVTVQLSPFGSDILLTGAETRNLSISFPGENLFPSVTASEKSFTVSWMQYHKGNVQLLIYDSRLDETRHLPLEQYSSAYPLHTVYYRGIPRMLLFRGNNSDNTDLFSYHLGSGEIGNISATPISEQAVVIRDEGTTVEIDTETLMHKYHYTFNKRTLTAPAPEITPVIRVRPVRYKSVGVIALNTIVGLGDSITWGKIRMNPDGTDGYHPEWAFLTQLREMFEADYGQTFTINLGVPGETSYGGTLRMEEEFSQLDAFFLLVMYGTNDVTQGTFDADATVENLALIFYTARDAYGLYPIMSTIPPQKDERVLPGIQFYTDATETLNEAIRTWAEDNDIPAIDPYTAFMESDDWEALLEVYKGNHPSPEGHRIIAGQFKEEILVLKPAAPENIMDGGGTDSAREVTWDMNLEFDFSHYVVEFGFSPTDLNRTATAARGSYNFIIFPFYRAFYSHLYFRIQSVDKDGNESPFTPVQNIRIN